MVRSSNWFILTVMGGMGNHLSWYEKNPFSHGDSNCLWVMRDLKSSVNWTPHIISLGMKTQTQTTGGFLKETPDKAENFFIHYQHKTQDNYSSFSCSHRAKIENRAGKHFVSEGFIGDNELDCSAVQFTHTHTLTVVCDHLYQREQMLCNKENPFPVLQFFRLQCSTLGG